MPQNEDEFMPVLRRPAGYAKYDDDVTANFMAAIAIITGIGFVIAIVIAIISAVMDDNVERMSYQEVCEQKLHGIYDTKNDGFKGAKQYYCTVGDYRTNMHGIDLPEK